MKQVLLVKLDAPASPLHRPSISDYSPLRGAREAVLTNELDNAPPTHLIRKVQICSKFNHLTENKYSIHDLCIFIVFIVLTPGTRGRRLACSWTQLRQVLKRSWSLKARRVRTERRSERLRRLVEPVKSEAKTRACSNFSWVISSQKDSTTSS